MGNCVVRLNRQGDVGDASCELSHVTQSSSIEERNRSSFATSLVAPQFASSLTVPFDDSLRSSALTSRIPPQRRSNNNGALVNPLLVPPTRVGPSAIVVPLSHLSTSVGSASRIGVSAAATSGAAAPTHFPMLHVVSLMEGEWPSADDDMYTERNESYSYGSDVATFMRDKKDMASHATNSSTLKTQPSKSELLGSGNKGSDPSSTSSSRTSKLQPESAVRALKNHQSSNAHHEESDDDSNSDNDTSQVLGMGFLVYQMPSFVATDCQIEGRGSSKSEPVPQQLLSLIEQQQVKRSGQGASRRARDQDGVYEQPTHLSTVSQQLDEIFNCPVHEALQHRELCFPSANSQAGCGNSDKRSCRKKKPPTVFRMELATFRQLD